VPTASATAPTDAPATRRRSRRHPLLIALLVVVSLLVLVVGGSIGYVRASASGHMYLRDDVPQRPVALVLGARVYADGTPSPSLADRLDLAKDLLDDGSVEVLLLSGDGHPDRHDEPAAMRAYLVEAGVDPARIVEDPHGSDTHDSCGRAADVYSVDALTVVSQSYHVPRAIAACRALGIDAVGVGDSAARDRKPDQWRSSVVREQLASVKAALDLVTGGDTVLDGPDPAVQDALASARALGTEG